MASKSSTNGTLDPVMQPFVDFWSNYMKQANETTREFLDGIEDQADVKTWQRRWFDAVGKSLDAYMRSPVFLHAMKQNTDAAVKLKQHIDDVASEIVRNANIPTAGDISGLFERLHSVEEVILERLKCIEVRLEKIEHTIGSGELANS